MRWIFTLYCTFIIQGLFAQQEDYLLKENYVWISAAGDGLGIDFNNTPPTYLNFPLYKQRGSNITTGTGLTMLLESNASVCDTNGKLLFYTDGTKVFDATGNMMPYGDSLIPDTRTYNVILPWQTTVNQTGSSVQGALIIPVIGAPNRYYVFSMTSTEFDTAVSHGHASELYYSVVDMTLNNGKGDVIVTQKGIFLDSNLNECLIAVAETKTKCSVWVLVHDFDNATIKAYNVNANGVNATPVISSNLGVMPAITIANYRGVCSMKASPNRQKLAVTYYSYSNSSSAPAIGGFKLYDFDPATGIVSNPVMLTSKWSYQSCFSPDNSKLYVYSATPAVFPRYNVDQYDLTVNPPTVTTIRLLGNAWGHDIQIGRDSKLYIFGPTQNAIGCIMNPNAAGTACNFVDNKIQLPTLIKPFSGLHNLYVKPLQSTDYNYDDIAVCMFPIEGVKLYAPTEYNSYLWSNGDTSSVHTVHTAGTYILQSKSACATRVDTFYVHIEDTGKLFFSLGKDTTYCSMDTVVLYAPIPNAAYLWQDESTLDNYIVTQSGLYTLQITDSGCTYKDSINIKFGNLNSDLHDDTASCANGGLVTLHASIPSGATIEWSNGSTASDIIVGPGVYRAQVTDDVCTRIDSAIVYEKQCECVFMPTAFSPNGDNKNDGYRPVLNLACSIGNYSIGIYNRWGEQVYNATDPNDKWDGTFQGLPQDIGVYMYFVKYTVMTESKKSYKLKGEVTLIR